MTIKLESLWYQKYRPSTLDGYVFQNINHKKSFSDMVTTKTIPHLLLTGSPGTGKSAISNILINACIDPDDEIDLLKLNASDNNSVDDIRSQVYSHITSMGVGPFKIVWLEEAEYLSPNAQGILLNYMEEYEQNCRFILICNNIHRIKPAIRSRCQRFNFSACDKSEVVELVVRILAKERIKLTLDTINMHVDLHYPDIRSIINSVEQHSKNGVLSQPIAEDGMQSTKLELLDFIKKDNWRDLRLQLCSTVTDEEWEEIYEYIYTNLESSPKFKNIDKWEEGIVAISEHLNQHINSAKPHINAASLLIKLGSI